MLRDHINNPRTYICAFLEHLMIVCCFKPNSFQNSWWRWFWKPVSGARTLRRPWVCAFSTFYQTFRGEHWRIDATPLSSINASQLWKCWRHSAKPSSRYQRNDFVRLVHMYLFFESYFIFKQFWKLNLIQDA